MVEPFPSDGPRRVAGAADAQTRAAAPFDLTRIAFEELTRRRANCARAVAANPAERPAAEAHLRLWCGIAAWFGAVLPEELQVWEPLTVISQRPAGGMEPKATLVPPEPSAAGGCRIQLWTDHAPRNDTAAQWRTRLADELRQAAQTAVTRAEAQATPDHQRRARHLLALDAQLSLAAALGPIFTHHPERHAA